MLMQCIGGYEVKILMINKFLHPNGGSETYIFKLGDYLQKKGHQVQYFGMEHSSRCVGNNINVYTKNMDFHSKSVLSKITYPLKTIYSVEARKKIRKVLDDFQPEVCHINNFNYQLTPSIILEIVKWRNENNKKCKIIYTAHDYQLVCPNHLCNNPRTHKNCEKCLPKSFLNCTKNKCIHNSLAKSFIGTVEATIWNRLDVYKHIDTIICCSKFMKSKLDINKTLSSKTVVIHNFIDKVEQKPSKKKNYILYFGRYSKEKGIETLLDVCKELPSINFVFAGSGPLEHIVNGNNIKNVGFQTGKKLEKLIREAKFTIYPSEWYENCPFSIMESQMYGTPVLGANIGGIPELIVKGKTGELFESGNENDLKQKILYLWNNLQIVDSYSENCKKVQFDNIDSYYEKIIKLYSNN